MRTLYLLRHAKSSWDDQTVADHERPLAPRGRRAARALGEHMRQQGYIPARVLCSSAARTRETWDIIAPRLGAVVPVEYAATLYDASPHSLLAVSRGVDESTPSLLIVGHNPAMAELALGFSADGSSKDAERMRQKFPSGALAVLVFEGSDWAVGFGEGRLDAFVRPKDLPEASA